MTAAKKLQSTLAGSSGEATYIDEIFSTYLYEGNSSTQTITNGIDLDGEGGLVWSKIRSGVESHVLLDSERSNFTAMINSDTTNAQGTAGNFITSTSSTGYTMGSNGLFNSSGSTYASWTFRKAPRFFDVVTYTGNGTSDREISHDLGCQVGTAIIKCTSDGGTGYDWAVWHKELTAGYRLFLNDTMAEQSHGSTFPSTGTYDDSVITISGSSTVNSNGKTYVAYLFAHDPLGPSGDGSDGLIACGSYTGDGSEYGVEVDLGWEPQWLLIKKSSSSTDGDWWIFDCIRGMVVGAADARLYANLTNSEYTGGNFVKLTATGFHPRYPDNGDTYIYMAIRRPMAVPESGSEVFAIDTYGSTGDAKAPAFRVGFPVDMALATVTSGADRKVMSRLIQGKQLLTNSTAAETSESGNTFDYMNGHVDGTGTQSNYYSWMFKRAPGFMDVVCYTGTGSLASVNHNLGVVPELIIVKNRSSSLGWPVVGSVLGGTNSSDYVMFLDTTAALDTSTGYRDADDTDTTFGVRTNNGYFDTNGSNYIAYLFATLAGISKVGSYTGNGTSQTIDCGFSAGARFVLIKRTDSTGDWFMWDSVRGIVAGDDPHLSLNTTAAEVTNDDSVDPDNSGFIVNQVAATNINVASAEYIFLAVS